MDATSRQSWSWARKRGGLRWLGWLSRLARMIDALRRTEAAARRDDDDWPALWRQG